MEAKIYPDNAVNSAINSAKDSAKDSSEQNSAKNTPAGVSLDESVLAAPTGGSEASIPRQYWVICSLLLLWALGYAVLIAEAFFLLRPEDFDRLVNAGMILPGYGDYVQHLPAWIIGLAIFKAVTRIAGAAGILLRKRWAVSLYSLSLAVSCLIFFRGFLLEQRASFEGATQIGLDILFFCMSVYALYFAISARLRGFLR